MKKWFLSALLALGVLSVTAGAAGAAPATNKATAANPVTVVYGYEQVFTTLNFGWGA